MPKLAKIAVAFFLATLFASTSSIAQGPNSNSEPDHFIGVWKLDLEKHPRSGVKSQTLTIEKQQNLYTIAFDLFGEKHDETHWSTTTDMNGGLVKPVQANGKPLAAERFTRLDSNSFTEKSDLTEQRYRVSEDGKTMEMEMIYLHTGGNTAMPKIVVEYVRAN
jgi:hypothetical protein